MYMLYVSKYEKRRRQIRREPASAFASSSLAVQMGTSSGTPQPNPFNDHIFPDLKQEASRNAVATVAISVRLSIHVIPNCWHFFNKTLGNVAQR